jgi:DNA-binding transcriptional LysR family regulator
MFDWNDLKFFLAVARHGGTLAASRALSMDASTVQRRLGELERHIGQPLVKRQTAGYRLTDFGQALLPAAHAVEQAVQAFEQQVVRTQREAARVLRLTCPEPLVYRITNSKLLDSFHARHPNVRVEFVMSDRYVDLSKGEADVALRSGDTDDNALVGRKIGDSLWAIYASTTYVERHGRPERVEDLGAHALVGFDDSMHNHRASVWLREVAPHAKLAARSDSVLGLLYSAKAGIGVAPLPTALGDAEPDMVRVLGPVDALTRIWRVLTTPELRHTPTVEAFFDFLTEDVERLRPIITG